MKAEPSSDAEHWTPRCCLAGTWQLRLSSVVPAVVAQARDGAKTSDELARASAAAASLQ